MSSVGRTEHQSTNEAVAERIAKSLVRAFALLDL